MSLPAYTSAVWTQRPANDSSDTSGQERTDDHDAGLDRLLRLCDVAAHTGISRATIYRLESRGEFPSRVHTTDCAMRWSEKEVAAWMNARLATARAA